MDVDSIGGGQGGDDDGKVLVGSHVDLVTVEWVFLSAFPSDSQNRGVPIGIETPNSVSSEAEAFISSIDGWADGHVIFGLVDAVVSNKVLVVPHPIRSRRRARKRSIDVQKSREIIPRSNGSSIRLSVPVIA